MPNTVAEWTRRIKLTLRKNGFAGGVSVGLLVLVTSVVSISDTRAATVGQMSERDPMVAKLAAPMKAIVDGVSFRDAVRQIAAPMGVNTWISREVDPSAKVELGPIGSTGFAALEQLAASRGCVAHFVGGVVVIGPADWVDRTSAAVMSLQKEAKLTDVAWPRLSTPDEALSAAGVTTKSYPSLPYDLWPETNWKQIDRNVAVELIRRQFDDRPIATPLTRRYRSNDLAAVRAAINGADPKSRVRVVDGVLEVRASAAAHREAAAVMMRVPQTDSKLEAKFSLKSTTSARNALNQLCVAAGRKCVIKDSAAEACEKEISIEAKDVSLREIIESVAEKAGVRTTWTDSEVIVAE